MQKLLKNKNYLAIGISIIIFLIVFLLWQIKESYILNKKVQNRYFALKEFLFKKQVHKNILVIEIDDKTLEIDKKNGSKLGRFPFDRQAYVPVIERLSDAGAGIIAFDIIFVDETSKLSDEAFFWAIKKAKNVMIGSFFGKNGRFNDSIFSQYARGTGFFEPKVDSINSVVYSITPYAITKSKDFYYQFSIAVLKAYYSYTTDLLEVEPKIDDQYFYLTADKKIPLARKNSNEVLINFSKYTDFKSNNTISFIDIYDQQRFKQLQQTVDFKDKIILIWATATGIKDIFQTPNGTDFWVYTHANMINTILHQNYLVYFNKNYELLLLFLLIILSVYTNITRNGWVLISSNLAIVTVFLIIFPFGVLLFTNLVINFFIELVLALLFSLTASNIAKYLVENKDKIKLHNALGEYVAPDIAREILSWEWNIPLDGEKKEISIFFSDIEWFTTISEKFSPEDLVWFLRKYLSEMSNVILDENGFINKYEGDAIMWLWWVFWEKNKPTAPFDACESALQQQELLQKLNIIWKQEWFWEIKARIGIHHGEAIIGNIWAQGRKMEFTALWDNVNLASRLEWVNKHYGTYICVSQVVKDLTDNTFIFRYLDKIKVKGKNIPVKIYELLGRTDNAIIWENKIYTDFEKAIKLYTSWDFQAAKSIFIIHEHIDPPSLVYLNRCEYFIKNGTPDNWDGVWTMKEK